MTDVPNRSTLASMLETMLLIRAYEEKAAAMQAAGQSAGTCTSVGQEASAVGVVTALGTHDQILTNHRSAGHLLARGAELSLASGVALAASMQGRDSVTACFFGDGAACEGSFHESLNLAATWKLPILYVCENNQWQAFVHRRETMPMDHVSTWAAGPGMRVATVDGNDVEAVYRAAQTGITHIRATGQPYFLETYTYRLRGHYEPDDQGYVDKDELAAWRARDPIDRLRLKLKLSDGELGVLHARVRERIEDAWSEAVAAPYPARSELTSDVYA